MNDTDHRAACLELAVKTAHTEELPARVVERAQAYYAFVKDVKKANAKG